MAWQSNEASWAGAYSDAWDPKTVFTITQAGNKVTVKTGDYTETATVNGKTVSLWGLTGTLSSNKISWSNDSEWILQAPNGDTGHDAGKGSTDEVSWAGAYSDAWDPKTVFTITQAGTKVTVKTGDYTETATVDESTISLWGLTGTLSNNKISWSNDSEWILQAPGGDTGGGADKSWDSPGAGGDTGGSWSKSWNDNKAADDKASLPTPNGKAFWAAQADNKKYGTLPRKEDWELEQIDNTPWIVHGGQTDVSLYEHVPVEISGDKSQHIPVFASFEETYAQFEELIPKALVENIRKCGYVRPTPVQKYALPVGLVGRDIMCCAQTGSGKTAAFLVPCIGRMMLHHEAPVGHLEQPFEGKCTPDTLILTPTRELCIQIHEEAEKFCHRTPYRCSRVYGGEAPKIQLEDLAKGCDLMVACPGRLADFIGREVVSMENVYILVLDEADRMLDMGFEKQIRDIVENFGMHSKEDRQTMMFSATFPDECQRMAQDFLYNYIWIGVGVVGGAVESVTQRLDKVETSKKYEHLIECLDKFFATKQDGERCLAFVNSKNTAKWLDEQLYDKHFDTGALHGNLTQTERETNLKRFRNCEIEVMIATDVAARGLDIEKVALVLNYDMPDSVDTYVHRIGRSGRIGNRGEAITFIATDDNGHVLESTDVLQKLHGIMRDAKSEVPAWLEGVVDPNTVADAADSWASWGGRDMRGNREGWNEPRKVENGDWGQWSAVEVK